MGGGAGRVGLVATISGGGRSGPVGRVAAAVLAGALLLGPVACGSVEQGGDQVAATPGTAAPSTIPGPDPAVRAYCDAVARVQAEQTGPQAGQGGLDVASQAARRQVADLVAVAPPEIANEWRTLQSLTEEALRSLAGTGGDPNRIDRGMLTRLEQQSRPTVERIQQVTSQRCGISFRPPA